MKKKLLYLSIILIGIVFVILYKFNFDNNKYNLEPITTTDWTTISSQNNSPSFVYLGRDSCDKCAEFKPLLEQFLKDNKIKAYYFDTSLNKENTNTIVKKYNIIGIPSIVVLKNNDYFVIMDENYQNILNQIRSSFK